MSKDFSKTLNLPATDFEMRANLPKREEETFAKWLADNQYLKLIEKNKNKPLFVFHDGPPFSNGDLHMGHALNKILKDFIVRYKNMSGFLTHYIHGWDNHGLPIETAIMKKQKINRRDVGDLEYRKRCAEFAKGFVESQKKQAQRFGVYGDWDNSYLTMQPRFEEEQIKIFGQMLKRGCIYKGLKPVYWCAHDETALAEAEIEYADDECDSIFVKFPLVDDKGLITPYTRNADGVAPYNNVYFVIWTTTPWTLPGNVAICVGPEFSYSLVKVTTTPAAEAALPSEKGAEEFYIIASELVETVMNKAGIDKENYEVLAKIKGSELERMVTRHPFYDRDSLVIVGDHVTLESGTGCVHTAPGHGIEDFAVCKNYKELPIYVPVDFRGYMTSEAGKYEGLKTSQANVAILEDLKANNMLLATEKITHQYPHCWRCKTPILFRATEQWFCSVDDLKKEALEAVKSIKWYPPWGELRMENMIKDRADWCISRQRIWGLPIPVFYCKECNHYEANEKYINKVAELFGREGSNAWYIYTPEEITGEKMICPKCGCEDWEKETATMDGWFDSGTSYAYVLKDNPNQGFPSEIYFEGNDQFRGWFQSSLLTSIAARGVAPYKMVITNGWVVDGEGKTMSKSLGNGIDPIDVINEYGSDVLRLWVSSVDYTADVRVSKDMMKQLSEIYRKIRNTARILLANLGKSGEDFDPQTDMIEYAGLEEIDKWALGRLNALVGRVTEAYEKYQYHFVYHDLHNFCTNDMSKLYIDITKDRLYVEKKDSKTRRSAQTVMYKVLHVLTRLIAPVLNFTSDEIWQHMALLESDDRTNVNFNDMPKYDKSLENKEIADKWDKLFEIRDDIMKALESARNEKLIGKSLDAKVIINGSGEDFEFLKSMQNELNAVFIVSQVELISGPQDGLDISVSQADGEKCERCWTYSKDCGHDEESAICPRCAEILKSL
ncbi:MAG: isoleucine--tRNA ligase [Oscillospiraceae bacterium]|nr:isoleucine--tRNA ligase [Oscillospiraceae bacterium]